MNTRWELAVAVALALILGEVATTHAATTQGEEKGSLLNTVRISRNSAP
jgi:hypothetical protein